MIEPSAASLQRPQTIVVTGASSGIGREIAAILANQGTQVIAIARDRERLAALVESHPSIIAVGQDIGRIDDLGALVDRLLREHGPIVGLINNAAIQHDRLMNDGGYADADVACEIATNLTAPIVLTRCLLPHFRSLARATVVNVTSGLAFVPKRSAAVYSATKAGLHLFSEGLRVQMRGSKLRVVEVVMPLVDTPMTAGRGRGKIAPVDAANAVVAGLWSGPETLYVGKARLLPPLLRFAPGLAGKILQRS